MNLNCMVTDHKPSLYAPNPLNLFPIVRENSYVFMQVNSRIHCSLVTGKRESLSGAEKLYSDGSHEWEPTISEGTKIAQLTEQNNGWME